VSGTDDGPLANKRQHCLHKSSDSKSRAGFLLSKRSKRNSARHVQLVAFTIALCDKISTELARYVMIECDKFKAPFTSQVRANLVTGFCFASKLSNRSS